MNRVLQLRQDQCIQQKELAIAIGVSRPTVSEWEHQKKDPSGIRLKKLSEFFKVSPSYILGSDLNQTVDYMPTDDEIKFALFKGENGITEEDFEDVKKYVEFVIDRRRRINGTK